MKVGDVLCPSLLCGGMFKMGLETLSSSTWYSNRVGLAEWVIRKLKVACVSLLG